MIHSFKYCKENVGDVGKVSEFKGSLIIVTDFKGGFIGEGVVMEDDRHGIILSLSNGDTIVSLFSRDFVKIGTQVARTGHHLTISVGEGMIGHVVSPLGYDLDNKKDPSVVIRACEIDTPVLNIARRRKITKFLETGLSVCDLVTPLGEGQRELIIGDRKTGKSHFLYQVALTQARKGKIVIYAFIGKKASEINKAYNFFKSNNVLDRMIIIGASAGDSPSEIFITPFSAMTVAEYFRDSGVDSVVILDDLSTHAKYYREISLLAKKFPGRESYPGDIFYTHARLLERAGNFDVNGKNISITAFPVAETMMGDFAGYIQTNLASITDGHLYFDNELFLKGVRPAINIFLSVTRVGRQTQDGLSRDTGSKIMKILKKHSELVRYLKFGTEISSQVKDLIDTGSRLFEFFKQVGYKTYPSKDSLKTAISIIEGKIKK
ncbi:hypothetical protein A2130_03140 [Candidatus Woesebacteria bacterium GWC2_33_12]|uniref:ATP synthase subunit alpha n=1 Tax=Candidatus Woesebacteria bacterium GW2011_GWB1_33_22 TaxID=1618566 RepID=A0A0F9ZXH2_9BACT|nr:MAG: ATP synthase subunit alpha [Candidatus Woesebacteria bacterium GW2011_GWC2_33_12]KKP41387.1 MAG: ATP synthase subunit alpha [Candidatus Woesebacteria bacterium GW2011_GWA2_33_20]KKP43641.1 MAG: ATP synthase subunit alpha [Candidatus Woesebacteria bacterium GW2011_GWB1_33_22]KKP45134.1 MAG: ATP synthase subunit alpha, F-type H+-transporting ATPase subunit alpha [Microgenomates group bacterium GW2011_GWC1_33_28]KKP49170.1 MAG: ATP synthase subunit alpha [Candidatus Woesebacteria bacterium